MILLRFSYQTIRAGTNLPDDIVNGENCLYILIDVPKGAPLGVWDVLPNAWECNYESTNKSDRPRNTY